MKIDNLEAQKILAKATRLSTSNAQSRRSDPRMRNTSPQQVDTDGATT